MTTRLSLLAAILVFAAEAQDGAARLESFFERLDTDKDGKIAKEELEKAGRRTAWLERADLDNDGKVNR